MVSKLILMLLSLVALDEYPVEEAVSLAFGYS